jgi:hypothetical protein
VNRHGRTCINGPGRGAEGFLTSLKHLWPESTPAIASSICLRAYSLVSRPIVERGRIMPVERNAVKDFFLMYKNYYSLMRSHVKLDSGLRRNDDDLGV